MGNPYAVCDNEHCGTTSRIEILVETEYLTRIHSTPLIYGQRHTFRVHIRTRMKGIVRVGSPITYVSGFRIKIISALGPEFVCS